MITSVIGVILNVASVILLVWKFLKPAARRVLGLGAPVTAVAVGAKAASTTAGALSRFPSWFVNLFDKGGKLRWLRDIGYFLKNSISAPILLGITFVLSAYFPTLFEKLFLVVGAVAAKLGIMFMSWASKAVSGMTENNTNELYSMLGETVDNLPHCFIDILGYCHLVENLGMIISTLIFVGLYNLVKYFFFRWV